MGKKLAINLAIIVWAIAAGIFASIKPWQVYQRQNAETKARTSEMREAENARDELLRKEGNLKTPLGMEEQLREKKYVKTNEVLADSDKK
jgi:cell shape-determining protein MreC